MRISPWPGIIAAVLLLFIIAAWASLGVSTERQAMTMIIEAQRHISAVQDAHAAAAEPATLRAAEDDLLVAQTAFNKSQFEAALEAARRASQTAQGLLAKHRAAQPRQQ
jgi:hypothetical protein